MEDYAKVSVAQIRFAWQIRFSIQNSDRRNSDSEPLPSVPRGTRAPPPPPPPPRPLAPPPPPPEPHPSAPRLPPPRPSAARRRAVVSSGLSRQVRRRLGRRPLPPRHSELLRPPAVVSSGPRPPRAPPARRPSALRRRAAVSLAQSRRLQQARAPLRSPPSCPPLSARLAHPPLSPLRRPLRSPRRRRLALRRAGAGGSGRALWRCPGR